MTHPVYWFMKSNWKFIVNVKTTTKKPQTNKKQTNKKISVSQGKLNTELLNVQRKWEADGIFGFLEAKYILNGP